ncbi:hypothetical protein HHK36_019188 [Tetracentron sinense]|uniref:Ethylene-insensitive protein 2 n=1 Tax=Tetracentron sinense TaxID=13715 RepID=A0A834YYU3_TETSI|nr:hypothetical protein HHK36_019188 [Tetracentron sinense]
MEAENSSFKQMSGILPRVLPTVGPVLLISMGYVDPGKWAAAVEGGARFGFDLVLLVLVFNFAAILCQYLAARIGVVTGKNLAQICSEEYNASMCIFLGVQAELSVMALELTMTLGIAHGLNLIFGVDLFTCVFLTAIDAVLFPIFTTLIGNCKMDFLCISIAAFILLCYVLGVLISQPEIPLVMSGKLTMISGESAFTLMSLLGANIMPHNFYVHSYIIQRQQGAPNISKGALCHDHFLAILCVFSGIFLVNYALMNSAASVFHSAGLVVLTFQDALLLMDQIFRSPIAPFAFSLALFISSQISSLTWSLGGQVVLHDFFRLDLPVWLHRATIRILAIVLALYCVWNSGAEGLYQMLIFTQVILAMLLPSSVIPLFRVASSRSIMGAYKISQFVEFLALTTFIGMLGLKINFVVEMLFGNSDWVCNLRWNMGSSLAVPYVVLLIAACASLGLMLLLVVTPLKSATIRLNSKTWNWDVQKTLCQPSEKSEDNESSRTRYHKEEPPVEEPALEMSLGNQMDNLVAEFDLNLPEIIMDSDQESHLTPTEEIFATTKVTVSPACHMEESASTIESGPVSSVVNISDGELLDAGNSQKIESLDLGKAVCVEGLLQTEKDDEEGDNWEPEESSRGISGSGPSPTSEGSGSFRSLSGKSDEGGNGSVSLSRLSGFGRAARRQLAAILDEFWGHLYDFHGQATEQAKFKKLDLLLGVDPNPATYSQKVDPAGMEFSEYLPSVSGRGSDLLIKSSMYNSPKQQRVLSSRESLYGIQTGSSSSWSNQMQSLNAYVKNSSRNVLDSGERRYSSLRLPPSSDGWDYQPATVHGYQIASYLNRTASDRNSDSLSTLLDSPTHRSQSLFPAEYINSFTYASGPKPHNGFSAVHASSMQDQAISRNNGLQVEKPYYDSFSFGSGENVEYPVYTKKYHSLPDISGLAVPHRDSYLSDSSAQWDSPTGFGPSIGRTAYEQSLYSKTRSRAGVPLAFDELSSSNVYRDSLPVQLNLKSDIRSMWSQQPFEQLLGVAGKTQCVGDEGVGSRPALIIPEATSHVDLEVKLLQSFRYCILKLLKLEGSDWLFRQNDRVDEDLIDRVAARERFHYEAETREANQVHMRESQYPSSDRKFNSLLKNDEAVLTKFLVSSVPHCGEGCVWQVDLIVSFGVWCIHRILELSIMESRPELWGKYTYVLNRLQGILDLAFSKPRTPSPPCFCLQVPVAYLKRSSPQPSNGLLPRAGKSGRGKCTTAATLLDLIKDVEIAVSCRKGRTGTAAGDVAFPKGKENLASVLKRYKRRLSKKHVGTHEGGSGSRS